MGLLSTVFTIVTVSLFTVYVFNAVFNIILLFYPLFYVPLLRPAPILPPNAQYHEPVYSVTQAFDLTVYITHSADKPEKLRYIKPAWRVKNLTKEGSFSASKELNYTLGSVGEAFLHAFLTITGKVPDKQSEKYDEFGVYIVDPLVKVMPILVNDTRNLLSEGPVPEAFRDGEEDTMLPHWKPKSTLQVVLDTTRYPHNTIPPDLAYRMNIVRKHPYPYLPIFDTNDMSVKRADWIPLNFTSNDDITVSLQVSISLTSLGMYRLTNTLESAFGQMLRPDSPFRVSDTEVENLRGMVFEVNPTLLAVTVLASLLHLLFEFLAIKEDVVHWRKIKYGEAGVSRTTVVLNAVSNTVVVGYLFDKREETSMLVVGGSIVTALGKYFDFWKVTKTFQFRIIPFHYFGLFPSITVVSSEPRTERQRVSQDADADAVRYLVYACVPLALGYATYSLFFWRHRGIYSWAIDTLMAAVYLVEFIQMLPQILLNHRLRSVEAMPLAAFLFRTVNTFVDDLFAFVIPMPTLTRLSAFRDDIVFVVLMWQWWVYPKRRAVGEEDEVKMLEIGKEKAE